MNKGTLEPEAPKVIRNIKWLILHGRENWIYVLIAAVIIILSIFYTIYFNINPVNSKTSIAQKNKQTSGSISPQPRKAKPPNKKAPEDKGTSQSIRVNSKKETSKDNNKQKDIPKHSSLTGKQDERATKYLDFVSDTKIFNSLPIDKKISFNREARNEKELFNNCPDFHSDTIEHFPWLNDCEINQSGPFGSIGDKEFYFALYNFFNQGGDYLNLGIGIFEGANNDYKKPFIFKVHLDISPQISNLGYSEPRIFHTKFGKVLALSCGVHAGSGGISYDHDYFFWNNSDWIALDSEKWKAELKRKLPKGLSIWNQMTIDLNNLTVDSRLWTEKDAHCCPTGGVVKVSLSIKQNRFVIDKLVINE